MNTLTTHFPLNSPPLHSSSALPSTAPSPDASPAPALASGSPAALVPTVFKWEHGGKEVYLAGTFNGWTHKLPIQSDGHGNTNNIIDLTKFQPDEFLVRSQSVLRSWDAPPPLPPRRGAAHATRAHRRRRRRPHTSLQPDASDDSCGGDRESGSDGEGGGSDSSHDAVLTLAAEPGSPRPSHRRRRQNTAVGLAEHVPMYDPEHPEDFSDDSEGGGAYGTVYPAEDSFAKEPPALPPHLRPVALNTDYIPTLTGDKLLPIPSHVALGHLYCTASRGRLVAQSVATRYKRKFTTTVFLSPAPFRTALVTAAAAGDAGAASSLAATASAPFAALVPSAARPPPSAGAQGGEGGGLAGRGGVEPPVAPAAAAATATFTPTSPH
ncbi:SIP2, partial [Symbiodinium sp. KB8]